MSNTSRTAASTPSTTRENAMENRGYSRMTRGTASMTLDTASVTRGGTGCVQNSALFQDPLLEESPTAAAPAQVRRRSQALEHQAEELCHSCPLLVECLYAAVVRHDVSGFVAGTTQRQRSAIRRELGITVTPEDFDTLAGVTGRHRPVDHDEVLRLRNANPQESLEALAHRLGCSLSTIKRHLRKARNTPAPTRTVQASPTREAVLNAYARVMRPAPQRVAA